MRIVVVEDEVFIRNGLGKMLGKIDPSYELVGKAADGEEGLAVICQQKPDLIITDIQMPKLDGLAMLARLRRDGFAYKAVVLTAYSDFQYAKMAIELGIENYLLKPIKLSELAKTLRQVEQSLNLEKRQDSLLSLKHMIHSCILGSQVIDEQLKQLVKERYEMNVEDPLGVLLVWLGNGYKAYEAQAERLLREIGGRMQDIRFCLIESERYSLILMVLYHVEDLNQLRQRMEVSVMPVLCQAIKGELVCAWRVSPSLRDIEAVFDQLLADRAWNLSFGSDVMITPERIASAEPVPLKYPPNLDSQASQALIGQKKSEFEQCFYRLHQACQDAVHEPQDIREVCVRYCMTVTGLAKQMGYLKQDVTTQSFLQAITEALTWKDIKQVLSRIYELIHFNREEDQDVSLLIKRAVQLIEEYYNQGITLEEIAQKLRVSEEYLSAQFKKQTGITFSETIRQYRINKVKELLLNSNLKLNQIADMAGYSDPKYMSKVFKEETGMLPAEYRKSQG